MKLNVTLQRALANSHLLPSDDYYEWLRIVVQIAQQHEEVEKEQGEFNYDRPGNSVINNQIDNIKTENLKNIQRELSASGRKYGILGTLDAAGDTYMGGSNMTRVFGGPNGKSLRAKWKNQEQIK